MTDDLITWLRTTIEGDREAAEATLTTPHRNAETGSPEHAVWTYTDDSGVVVCGCGAREGVASGNCGCCWPGAEGRDVDLRHIALHDPRDTIARCEAELKILDLHKPVDGYGRVEYRRLMDPGLVCEVCCFDWDGPLIGKYPCETLVALAAGRCHRPGFRPEWVDA